MKAVIMAGGKGTRIASVARDIPKPMIPIEGKPVLEHELECLREQGFTDIILTVSHLGHVIMDYFGDGSGISPATGKPFGVKIEYFVEAEPLGNAGALFRLKDKLTEDFLLLNADAIFDIDFGRFVAWHWKKGGLATLFTHPNSHPYDSGLILADEDGAVRQWLTKEDARPQWYRNRVNAGLHVLSPALLEKQPDTPKIDLDRQLLKPLAGTGKMYCYDSPEYVKDMGTPERYEGVCRDYAAGLVRARNLRNKQRAIFLDRDGTINRYVGFLRDIEQFELLPRSGGGHPQDQCLGIPGHRGHESAGDRSRRGDAGAASGDPRQDGNVAGARRGVCGRHLLLPAPPAQGLSGGSGGIEDQLRLPQAQAGAASPGGGGLQHRPDKVVDDRGQSKRYAGGRGRGM